MGGVCSSLGGRCTGCSKVYTLSPSLLTASAVFSLTLEVTTKENALRMDTLFAAEETNVADLALAVCVWQNPFLPLSLMTPQNQGVCNLPQDLVLKQALSPGSPCYLGPAGWFCAVVSADFAQPKVVFAWPLILWESFPGCLQYGDRASRSAASPVEARAQVQNLASARAVTGPTQISRDRN